MGHKLSRHKLLRELAVEFFGTMFLLTLGTASCCAAKLSNGAAGNTVTVFVGWALAVTFAVLISAAVTGGHVNPAVSFAFAVAGDLPWKKFVFYAMVQNLGAFLGAAITYGVYYDAIEAFDGGYRSLLGANGTADLFALYPPPFLSAIGGLVNEILSTSILLICVVAIVDTKNNLGLPKYMLSPMVGLTILLITCTFGFNACALNPARDFGPRLFTSLAGWGLEPFSFRGYNWFWIPLVGPMVGGPLGVYVYKAFVTFWTTTVDDENDDDDHVEFQNVNNMKNGGRKINNSVVEKSMDHVSSKH